MNKLSYEGEPSTACTPKYNTRHILLRQINKFYDYKIHRWNIKIKDRTSIWLIAQTEYSSPLANLILYYHLIYPSYHQRYLIPNPSTYPHVIHGPWLR